MSKPDSANKATSSNLAFLAQTKDAITKSDLVKGATSPAATRTASVFGFFAKAAATTGLSALSLPAVAMGLASTAAGAVSDTVNTHSLRNIKKENSLLYKYRLARSRQQQLLQSNVGLTKKISDNLYYPPITGTTRPSLQTPEPAYKGFDYSTYGRTLLAKSYDVISTATKLTPSWQGLKQLAMLAKNVYGEGKKQATRDDLFNQFTKQINQEKSKTDAPLYSNLTELESIVRAQRIQTIALEKLYSKNLDGVATKDVLYNLKHIKQQVRKKMHHVQDRYSLSGRVTNYAKSFVKAHNPWSKYNNLEQMQVRQAAPIVKESEVVKSAEVEIDAKLVQQAQRIISDIEIKAAVSKPEINRASVLAQNDKKIDRTR